MFVEHGCVTKNYVGDVPIIVYFFSQTNFGHVEIPSDFQPPREVSLGQLGFTPPSHAVSANVYLIDTQRFRLENLFYDGLGPGTKFKFAYTVSASLWL